MFASLYVSHDSFKSKVDVGRDDTNTAFDQTIFFRVTDIPLLFVYGKITLSINNSFTRSRYVMLLSKYAW